MSKAKFESAKALIEQERYAEARQALMTIDHEKAADWLKRLDAVERKQAATLTQRQRSRRRSCLLVLVILLVIAGAVGVWLAQAVGRVGQAMADSFTQSAVIQRVCAARNAAPDCIDELNDIAVTVGGPSTFIPLVTEMFAASTELAPTMDAILNGMGIATGTPVPPTEPAK